MKTNSLVLSLVLCSLWVNSPAVVVAQQVNTATSEWTAVRAISPGEKLNVRMKDGKNFAGRLRSVTDTSLTLDRGDKTSDLSRGLVSKVYQLVGRSVGKSLAKPTAIGAGVGFGIGAGVGIAAGGYEDLDRGALVAILGGLGAGIGAGIGALVGSLGSKEKRVLIYEGR